MRLLLSVLLCGSLLLLVSDARELARRVFRRKTPEQSRRRALGGHGDLATAELVRIQPLCTRGLSSWRLISAAKERSLSGSTKWPEPLAAIKHDAETSHRTEAVRKIPPGAHKLRVECAGGLYVDKLVIKAIPELMHCGLGFDPAIKSYGKYDVEFLKQDILPNVTTLIVPPNRPSIRRLSTIGTAREKSWSPPCG